MHQFTRIRLFGRRVTLAAIKINTVVLLAALVVVPQTVAQSGQTTLPQTTLPQTTLPQTTLPQTTVNQGRTAPAPWRPSFGTISRQAVNPPTGVNPNPQTNVNPQTSVNPGTIPSRQPLTGNSGGLAAPNSPYNVPATAINLQTGTTTQIANPASGSQLPPSTTTGVLQLPSTASANQTNSGSQTNSLPATQVGQQQTQTAAPVTQPASQSANQSAGQQSPFIEPVTAQAKGAITRVTKSMTQLPNDAGQVWREYDITPYTSQMTGVTDPQQAILDWVLRETGKEMWFNQPLGILNADKDQLRVYHTPEIQNIVHKIVDRFVNTRGQVQNLEVSLVTVGRPNWRSTAYPVLQPIEVQSPGVEAWMISKENAALLRASLARRSDFEDQGTGRITHNDGQAVVMRNTQPVQFIRNFRWTTNQIPPYQPLVTTIDEGYTLEISSLTSLDGSTIEACIECHVDQVEKLNTVKVEVPGTIGTSTDKISLQIPQVVSWRLKERFRWQNDQVLLLSCGVVATPTPQTGVSLPSFLGGNRQRADALLFVDYRGPDVPGGPAANTALNRTVPVTPRR